VYLDWRHFLTTGRLESKITDPVPFISSRPVYFIRTQSQAVGRIIADIARSFAGPPAERELGFE
jgi:hypothetical protein